MKEENKKEGQLKKVFFITSNQVKNDEDITYQIPKNRGLINLKAGNASNEYREQANYKNSLFTVYVNSFEVSRESLKEEDKDNETKKYKSTITLKYGKSYFYANIIFSPTKNDYIYDLKFLEFKSWGKTYFPPPQISFSLFEQFNIYIKYMKAQKKMQKDEIYKDLIDASKQLCGGPKKLKIEIEFFLEILRNCIYDLGVKMFIRRFKIEYVTFTKTIDLKKYIKILNLLERNPSLIIKYCTEKDNKELYYTSIYYLIFSVRYRYDTNNAIEMLKKKELWDYFIKFLPGESHFFNELNIPDELLEKMFDQPLKDKIIMGILNYCNSIEQILKVINSQIKKIADCFVEAKTTISMSLLSVNPKQTDNIENIIKEIGKITNYETNNDKIFVSFDNEFWKHYIQFTDDANKLSYINKAIILCANIDKNLKIDNKILSEKIHKVGLESIKAKTLTNEKILEFIKIDKYFLDNKYANTYFRPLELANGFDFDNMTDEFISSFRSSLILKIYSFADGKFENAIVKNVQDMKNFGKLLKLFYSKDGNKDENNEKKIFERIFVDLRKTFKNSMKTYKIDTCPNFVDDVALYIYITDLYKLSDIKDFMKQTIETYIQSFELKQNIYIALVSNYNDISKKAIDGVTDFLTFNKEKLDAKGILILLEKLNSNRTIESLLNKIESLGIKEEELFNQELDTPSFQLLDGILKKGLFNKLDINKTKYLMNAIQTKEKMIKKIKEGEISFDLFKKSYITKEKKEIFYKKLKIILFNNEDDFKECTNSLTKRFSDIIKVLGNINKLKDILIKFLAEENKADIIKVENLGDQVKVGMMNEIEKSEFKKEHEEIFKILTKEDYDKMIKLKDSIFFVELFRARKAGGFLKKESKIFKQTEEEFNKLRLFFQSDNWSNDIPETIITDCFKGLKNEKRNKLRPELKNLINYFKIENFDELKLQRLENGIIIFNQKEDICKTANSCIHFIDELEAEHTDFYNKFDIIRKGLQTNVALEKIENFGKILQENGLNVLNPNEEDQVCLTILHSICDKKNCVKFVASLDNNDIRTLQELVNMSDDTFVTSNAINDMIKCSTFIHDLGEIKGKMNDKQLIEAFIKEIPKKENKGIEAHFKNYANYAAQIQELFNKKLDPSQATLQQITNIMKNSTFILSINNTQDPYLKFEGEFFTEENKEIKKDLKYDKIIELRERAMLTRKLGNDNEEEKKIFTLYRLFSERVSELEKINQLLKNLGEKGYSEDIKIVIHIKDNNPSFSIENKKVENYEECSKYLTDLYSRINAVQTKYYKNEELIRYIYGRQFNLLNSCLRKKRNNALAPFLKFLTNDKINSNEKLKNLNFDYDYNKDPDKYICLFENIKKFLSDFLNNNNLKLENIYEQNIIQEQYRNNFKGLYIYLVESKEKGEVQRGIEEHILNWFNFLTGHPPMAQTVLLCNEETTSEELTAFMYRAFLCKYPVFFMIGKIELLTSDKRQTLTNLINILFSKRSEEMKSCVAFGYSVRDDSLVRTLENLKGRKFLKHDDKIKMGKKLYKENVEIISSDKAGVGKSTQIKLKILNEGKKYIHFPFGGEFSRKDVINRLIKVQDKIKDEEKTVIHLDLYDSKQVDLMKDFLYSFLVTKLYGQNENLFYLSKKVKIIIEIPCGFIDFFNKYPLLSLFENQTHMEIAKLPQLIVSKEIDSNVQIVCNYLKLLNSGKLSVKDLIISGVSISKEDIKNTINEDIFNEDTTIDATSLDAEECDALIKDLFKNKLKIDHPTYYQINSFINVFSGQLKNFSMNFGLSAAKLIETGILLKDKQFQNLREIMVRSFIQNTIHFTQGAFDKILNAPPETYKIKIEQGNYDEKKQEEIAVKALSEPGDIISCQKIHPPLVFFHEGEGQEFSIITNDDQTTEEYNKLLNLKIGFVRYQNLVYRINKSNKRDEEPKELKHYTKFDRQELFWEEIKQILSINNPVYNKDKKNDYKKLKSIEEIVGEYVFTADNFVKMILILLRIRENIPVIMMGETGCGKTSLIRKLSELINNGEKKMEIMNIHAGITDEEIVNFLFKEKKKSDGVTYPSIIETAKKLKESEEKKESEYKALGQKYFKKKLWVFLDEINTCNCMGLICELMTKHTCQGVELPDNIFFIGACNPYRYGKSGANDYALKLKDVQEKNLVYTVNPLPFSLLNFVFNFGNLTSEDEKRYIKNMVVNPIKKIFWNDICQKHQGEKDLDMKNMDKFISKEDSDLCNDLIKLSSDAIIEAQEFVRGKNDVSSVSLREIRRFSIFYEFFVDYFLNNKKIFEKMDQNESFIKVDDFYKNLTKSEIYRHSIKLSIYLCYYMRLISQEFRGQLAAKMNKIFGDNFIEIPEHEQQFIAGNIELGVGIAKNRALLENLFTLFSCINAKIPLFIVGKPGCSKSLSVQLLFKAMQGDASDNFLFKSLPKLFINAFQGSLGSTSKGVLNIFKTARNILKNNEKNLDKIISMIYFDEMGLAEHSPNNPLKVIHSELEYDLNEGSKKIAFVGISNWVLDASKMNRGLFLSIPPPDQKDLEATALTIAESYNEKLAKDNIDLFKALANTYHDYKEELKTKYTINEDFHGSRDFYHLIKTAMRILLKKISEDYDLIIDENVKQEIGIISIERNFAGLEIKTSSQKSISSLEIIKGIFKKYFKNCDTSKNYKVLQTIYDNIKDKDSRYLLLVAKSSISNYLLNSILTSPEFKKDINKELSFYIGSGFYADIHSEGYGLKILNKIQLQMEQNKILLLSDLEAMYPSLYDLFNQNFTVVSKKNYARIAMGSTNNTFSLVNDGFKCIVLVDEKDLEQQKAPFLNRFEKHIISFEYLLDEKFIKEADRIYEMVQNFGKIFIKDRNINLKYNVKHLLINCDKEEIRGITYNIYSEYKKKKEEKNLMTQDIQDFILEKIAPTLSQDIILLIKNSGFEEENPGIPDKIIEFYKRGEHSNLLNFLKKMKNTKNVIYTFTSIDNALLENVSGQFDTELLGRIDKSNIKEVKINSLNEEKDLEGILEDVYLNQKDKIKIVLFKFTPYQAGIMNYIKFFIENHIKEKNYIDENNRKVFIFSVHMNRIFIEDENNPKRKRYVEENILTDTITHLSDYYQIFIDDLNGEDFSIVDIMKMDKKELFKKCLKLDVELTNNIYKTFSYFNYSFKINIKGIDKDNYSKKILQFLKNNQDLTQMFINCILKQSDEKINIGDILNKDELFDKDNMRSIIEIVQKYLSSLFNDNLNKLIFKLEKDNFLSTFIFNNEIDKVKFKPKPKIVVRFNNEEENNLINERNQENNEEINEDENIIKNYYLNNNLIKLLIQTYLENVNFSRDTLGKNMKNNKVQLLMGLKLPGIFPLLVSIINNIKGNIKNKYLSSEKCILFLYPDEQNFDQYLNQKKNEAREYQRRTEIELKKNKIFEKIDELKNKDQRETHEFYELLMNDYYLIFLSKNVPEINEFYKKIDEYKNLINYMLELRFIKTQDDVNEDEVYPIKAITKKILWIEAYSQYISILLNIYRKLSEYEEEGDLLSKIKVLINDKEIFLEQDEKSNPYYTIDIKSPFYYISEALLRLSINKINSNELKEEKFYDFINLLKTINKDISSNFIDLNIYSKENYTINEFLEIEASLHDVNKNSSENILKTLEILLKVAKTNIEENVSEKGNNLSDYIEKLFDFLFENLGNTENFRELIMGIFVNELLKVRGNDYRKTLVNKILQNKNLIIYSYEFMSILTNELTSENPKEIKDNITKIQNEKSPWMELINKANDEALNQILLSIFEKKINIYFEEIPKLRDEDLSVYFKNYYDYWAKFEEENPTLVLSNTSLEVFQDCIYSLETIYNNRKEEKEDTNNDLICELYSIAYIKIYMYKYINFTYKNFQIFSGHGEILKAIEGNAKTNVRKMIKIYAFKVFFYLIGNYQDFKDFNFKNHQINFFDELKDKFQENKVAMLNYYMLPNNKDKMQVFKEYFDKFDIYKFDNFSKPINQFVDYIKNNGIDNFYMISTDLIVSNLSSPNYEKDLTEYTKYSSFTKNLFNDPNINLPDITKKLFFLFSNDDTFNNTMKPKLIYKKDQKIIDANQFEILLYGLRFCLQTTNCQNPDGFLYPQIIAQDGEKKISKNCIPGNNTSGNYYVQNYINLEKHLNTKNSDFGAYVCGCGYFYSLEPCGFPRINDKSGTCPTCKNKIGSGELPPGIKGYHGFAHVPGHYRIFKNLEAKKKEFARFAGHNPPDSDENIPNMLLADYKKKIDDIKEKEKLGISKVKRNFFEDTKEKVRNQSQIGYRLLNFILYSHLFYANCLGFIKDEDMKKYVCDDITCIDMLETDWNILKVELQSKSISIIQIFLNLIFDKLSEKIKNCKEILSMEERDKFENEIEKLLEESYKEYADYAKFYNENNNKMLELDNHSMKSLVTENNDVILYDENNYPFYRYFLMTTYPTEKNFKEELQKINNYETKYPFLTNYIINKSPTLDLIKYLPEFNDFSNFMIDYYSYKISRDDAAKKKITDEDLYKNDENFQKKFKRYQNIWNKLSPYAVKYGCRDEMKQLDLKIENNQILANFLNDDGDMEKGMYVAAAYQNFVEWQNTFLDSIIEPSRQSGILHHYVRNMEQAIDVQSAKKNETLNFSLVDFTPILYDNSRRNIFKDDHSINYMNYKQFIYDFDNIEKHLGELVLPGKVKFSSEKLKFVTFCFEGFRGKKSSVFITFSEKYKEKVLSIEKKQEIYNIIAGELNKQKEDELTNILFSIQLLMYYLTQEIRTEKEDIKIIISELPDYVKLSKECKELLDSENLNIKVEDLIGVYNLFESLCFTTIIKNLQPQYKKQIDDSQKKAINKLFDEKKIKFITKKTLATACRKFISRYLVSSRKDDEFNESNDLSFHLTREELWPKEFYESEENNEVKNSELNLLKNLDIPRIKDEKDEDYEKRKKIIIGQCYELYQLLGGDENEELKGITLKKINLKENNDEDEDEDDDNKKFRVKRRLN